MIPTGSQQPPRRKALTPPAPSATPFQKWLNRLTAVLCIAVFGYICAYLGAHIERRGLAIEQDLFLRFVSQRVNEANAQCPDKVQLAGAADQGMRRVSNER